MQTPNSPDNQETSRTEGINQQTESKLVSSPLSSDPKRLMGFIGYFLVTMSSLLAFVLVLTPIFRFSGVDSPENQSDFVWFVQNYADEVLGVIVIIFFSLIGLQLLGAAGKTTPRVIPDEDRALLEPLVRDANKEAINQYVILSSLSGFTGTFQKIGFSGLPLATAALTLLFCGLSLIRPEFIEFAKLTLGAFIGSFVQRNADTEQFRYERRNQSNDSLDT